MAVLPEAMYRFNAILIQILTQFFTGLERTISPFIWKQTNKKSNIAKPILNNKRTPRGITVLDFKLYCRDINKNSMLLAQKTDMSINGIKLKNQK
jgi:O-glycosyl hydrolase